MNSMMLAMLLAAAQAGTAEGDPAFRNAAAACGAKVEGVEAIAAFLELRPNQTIAEYQPDFVLTGCLAEAVRGRGRFLAVVEGGDRIVQVVRRAETQNAMKRAPALYSGAGLVAIKPGKPAPAEHSGKADRILITGSAKEMVADPKRGAGLLRTLLEMTAPSGLLGIVDVPGKGGVDEAKLAAIAAAAGWQPAGRTVTGGGLMLLKFRRG
ncbi:MAG TPA: hypothetical protein VF619_03320 [Allosphingosinicella sp.]|jgi:hypothetical protein